MKMSKPHTWLRPALLAVPVVAVQVAVSQLQADLGYAPMGAALAQEQQADQRETRKTPALRNKVYEKLAEAQAAAEAQDFNTAAKILDEMLAGRRDNELNSYELANVYNLYAFIHYSREDYPKALQAYENVIKQPDIPLAMEINTRYTVAQLYFVQEQWQKGIDALNKWFAMTETPNANAYVLLAQGYYQMKDYDKSLSNVNKAISMYRADGKIPKEQWLNLARFLYFDKGDVNNAVAVLEELLTHYPKKDYWVQLSHMYGEQKKETDQLSAMETAYVQGMLDRGTELVTMAYLYLNGEVPWKAAQVVDKGLKAEKVEGTSKNYEILGNALRQAQEVEKAIPAMEQAAAKSDDGELYARLGNIYLDGEQYDEAIEAINKGLKRGGVKRPDTARLVLGMAYFEKKQYAKARDAFQAAGRDKRSAQFAEQWIKYMDSELDRQKKLAEG
ncbi:tetratricopeptide repeat protein [Parahaliea mediterranea]|uniref:tetratricopeptide repeat protein n=1 Tax=Parahaliea mediterranea TaxID=651086 RepID=UPI000E2FD63F|nr:tetratricopeptide repeat protein [Parahaliea mediterranea]